MNIRLHFISPYQTRMKTWWNILSAVTLNRISRIRYVKYSLGIIQFSNNCMLRKEFQGFDRTHTKVTDINVVSLPRGFFISCFFLSSSLYKNSYFQSKAKSSLQRPNSGTHPGMFRKTLGMWRPVF